MSNFKETVNLKDKMAEMAEKRKPVLKKKVNKAEDIDRLYETSETKKNTEFKKMNRPKNKGQNSNPYKGLVFVLIVVVALFSYFAFFNKGVSTNEETTKVEEKWYSIKLNNDETFYGLVGDVSSDPVVVKDVYYNYDQTKDGGQAESANLRLVKRGKETHGPDGTMDIIRSQVQYLEQLSPDSKVLQAIMANEK